MSDDAVGSRQMKKMTNSVRLCVLVPAAGWFPPAAAEPSDSLPSIFQSPAPAAVPGGPLPPGGPAVGAALPPPGGVLTPPPPTLGGPPGPAGDADAAPST